MLTSGPRGTHGTAANDEAGGWTETRCPRIQVLQFITPTYKLREATEYLSREAMRLIPSVLSLFLTSWLKYPEKQFLKFHLSMFNPLKTLVNLLYSCSVF